ncbi:MAG: hypothetical protein ACXW04_01125 [Methylobacter sp.]
MDQMIDNRRSAEINDLNVRVAILEAIHIELNKSRESHSAVIERLLLQDSAINLALNSINEKFDALIKQFALGFKIIVICSGLVTTIVGAGWIYTHDLNDKYMPKLEKIVDNTATQKTATVANTTSIEQTRKDIRGVTDKLNAVNEDVDDVTQDVSHIKKLKVVRGSR